MNTEHLALFDEPSQVNLYAHPHHRMMAVALTTLAATLNYVDLVLKQNAEGKAVDFSRPQGIVSQSLRETQMDLQ